MKWKRWLRRRRNIFIAIVLGQIIYKKRNERIQPTYQTIGFKQNNINKKKKKANERKRPKGEKNRA